MLPRRVTDIAGNIYGKLTVLEYTGNNKRGEAEWSCKCECGKQVTVKGTNLRKGVTISCGCARKKIHNTGNLEGKTFGDLTVLSLYETDTKKKKKSSGKEEEDTGISKENPSKGWRRKHKDFLRQFQPCFCRDSM